MNKKIRLEYLDSVRGIAALMVVFYHFIGWQRDGDIAYNLASMIFNGSDAVSFFFVLSGFVLSYQYFRFADRTLHLPQYVYKRILRLYPAFIFTVLINYLYWHRNKLGWPVIEDIFFYNEHLLWEELLMVGRKHQYYIPGWTLSVEMVLSLWMPLFILLAKKNIKYIFLLLPIGILLGFWKSVFTYFVHFGLGTLLAYYYPQIRYYDFSKHRLYKFRYVAAFLVFLLFSIRHLDRLFDFGKQYDDIAEMLGIDFFFFTAFASFLILIWIINQPKTQDFLHHQWLVFLGKISYGIYLMHWLIVVYIMENWKHWDIYFTNSTVKFLTLLFITLIATILSGTFVYYFIEKPFIRFAKTRFWWQFWLK